MLKHNTIKVSIGFLLGTILLYLVIGLAPWLISLIQTVFFIILYTILDKIIEKIKKVR